MLGTLFGWVFKTVTGDVLGKAIDVLNKRVDSETERRRIEKDLTAEYLKAQVQMNAIAATEPWYAPRNLMAYCAVAYVFKLVVWDTLLGWGSTPDPGSIVNWIATTIIGFYFGGKTIETVAGRFANAIGRK